MNELDFLNEIKELEKLTKNNGFTCRKLKESDWETLVGWWKWWKWAIMPKDFLPENGTGGLIVEKNKTPIVAGFLYKTNSNYKGRKSKTKQKNEIIGSTSKIYAQKGTGGARHASRKAPIFVGGGIAHGPKGELSYKTRKLK